MLDQAPGNINFKGILKSFVKIIGKYFTRVSFLRSLLIKFQACSDTVIFLSIEHLQWLLFSDVAKLKEKKNRAHN